MLRPVAVAVGFLTRIPVATGPVEARDLGRAVTWFPAVGAALGAGLVGIQHLLGGVLAPGVLAVVLVAAHAAVTGGLHLDGVADVFDALGGGRGQRDRMLAIMRDSRIGAHGAAALMLVLAAKVVAVAEVLDRSAGRSAGCSAGCSAAWSAAWALYASPAAARWVVVPIVVGFPYARRDGLGKAFHGHAGKAQLAGATALAALAMGWIGTRAIVPGIGGALAALALAVWLYRKLGGLTGDVYGAAIELAELAFLIVAGHR